PDAYDIQETKGALRHALEQYKEIFLKIWDSDFHREEYLFFGWDIYRCAMGWLKKYKIQDNEIRQMILREYHESENALYSFREKWRELLQKKNQELGELWMR
ncbi:MAG: hypothetical protein IJ733_00400, partial [Lachnospiraceae bacterium]|nr:hypothetical protein [Lachnospiraceae bacterium]